MQFLTLKHVQREIFASMKRWVLEEKQICQKDLILENHISKYFVFTNSLYYELRSRTRPCFDLDRWICPKGSRVPRTTFYMLLENQDPCKYLNERLLQIHDSKPIYDR